MCVRQRARERELVLLLQENTKGRHDITYLITHSLHAGDHELNNMPRTEHQFLFWPVVQYCTKIWHNRQKSALGIHTRNAKQKRLAIRRQFPVRLAYSVTINKGWAKRMNELASNCLSLSLLMAKSTQPSLQEKTDSAVKVFIKDNDNGTTELL